MINEIAVQANVPVIGGRLMNERYVKGRPMKYKVKFTQRINGYRITGYVFCSLREAVRLRGQKKND